MHRIAIDLTPLLPGGDNGGAKLLVLELLFQFGKAIHDFDFLLLTADWNHQELGDLTGSKFERLLVIQSTPPPVPPKKLPVSFKGSCFRHLGLVKSFSPVIPLAKRIRRRWARMPHNSSKPDEPRQTLLLQHGVSLLFCPFTAPTYSTNRIPTVSIVYDLQHRYYPQFFSAEELSTREATLDLVRRYSETIICISEFTRRTLLSHCNIDPMKTCTVPVCIHARLKKAEPLNFDLNQFHLENESYLFYPANFWPHKNHKMLLTAYNIFCRRNPDLKLDLVFTGALAQAESELKSAVQKMGLNQKVHFLGYLSDENLAIVLRGCKFVIFPSLFEGFGIPLLEAFSFDKPVLCSRVGSLPEIGEQAVNYFDPRKPMSIVESIEQLLMHPGQISELVERGRKQLSKFNSQDMAHAYLDIFDRTLSRTPN